MDFDGTTSNCGTIFSPKKIHDFTFFIFLGRKIHDFTFFIFSLCSFFHFVHVFRFPLFSFSSMFFSIFLTFYFFVFFRKTFSNFFDFLLFCFFSFFLLSESKLQASSSRARLFGQPSCPLDDVYIIGRTLHWFLFLVFFVRARCAYALRGTRGPSARSSVSMDSRSPALANS